MGPTEPVHAQTSEESFATLTNRTQLTQLPKRSYHLQWPADLHGTVLAGGDQLALISFDEPGEVRTVDSSGCPSPLRRGQRITYRGYWLIGEGSERPDLWATVNNDGKHSMVARSGQAVLTAGRHPFRLLYFNAANVGGLEVSYQGPGIPGQPIPNEALWHQEVAGSKTNWLPGISYRYFQSNWLGSFSTRSNFALQKPVASGISTNFDLGLAKTTSDFAFEFTGFIEIPRDGLYEFTTVSDDGSLLFIGRDMPEISIEGTTNAVPIPQMAAGQAWDSPKQVAGVAAAGNAVFVLETPDGLQFELAGDSGRTFASLLNPGPITPELLNNARVNARGLGRNSLTPEGVEVVGELLIPSYFAVDILKLPNQTWSTVPAKTIHELKTGPQLESASTRLSRVSGRLVSSLEDGNWRFADSTGELPVILLGPESDLLPKDQPAELLLVEKASTDGSQTALTWRKLAPGRESQASLPVLTSIEEIKRLPRNEAQRGYPVQVRGVVTFIWPGSGFFLQDDSWSIDVRTTNQTLQPRIGEFWEIDGFTFAEFAPNILAGNARLVGPGTMPAPDHPALPALINGSLDTKYVEIQGVVSSIEADRVMLLTREGWVRLQLLNVPKESLDKALNALVRIRGCVVPGREQFTQQVRIGEVGLMNANLTIDQPAPRNIFDAPLKTVPELLLFDAQLTSLQRVKIHGTILHQRDREFFFLDGSHGARFMPKGDVSLRPGDQVDIVGFPDLKGAAPLLREATVRKTAEQPLPPPVKLLPEALIGSSCDSTLVEVEAHLLAQRRDQSEQILELQIGTRPFLARLYNSYGRLPEMRTGSLLTLRGVYVGMGGDRVAGREIDGFELLLNSPADVRVTRLPTWWTASRAWAALAILAVVLLGAVSWIFALRRRVAQRTIALTAEVEDHKRTEHQLELKTQMLQKEIEERRRMEKEIEKGHKELIATSRLAGMAEVATSVLHNVGNVMTSVNVLSSAIVRQVHESKASSLVRLGELLRHKQPELGKFLTEDKRGQLLPGYVTDLGGHLANEQSRLLEKVNALKENIHHINEIVALQQDYASTTGMLENVTPVELVENALLMHGESLKRHNITLVRDFEPLASVTIDRHKSLQILFNLLENAKHACLQTTHPSHKVVVSLRPAEGEMFELSVSDNGMGISTENLRRIFDQGFSTRRDGHGFGLHSSILMAQDMGGTMGVHSDGPGNGATFTLRLPNKPPSPAPRRPDYSQIHETK